MASKYVQRRTNAVASSSGETAFRRSSSSRCLWTSGIEVGVFLGGRSLPPKMLRAGVADGPHLRLYALRSGLGAGAGGATGVGTSVDGPEPGAMVIFSPGLASSGSYSFIFM